MPADRPLDPREPGAYDVFLALVRGDGDPASAPPAGPPARAAAEEARAMLTRCAGELVQRHALSPAVEDAVRTLHEAAAAVVGLAGGEMTAERLRRAITNDPLLYAVYRHGVQDGEARATPAAPHAEALGLIAAERRRQVEEEGWAPEHDDAHNRGEMARAAACYAMPPAWRPRAVTGVPYEWPWGAEWWKPTLYDRVRELVKAGALIVSEIERLQRAARTPAAPRAGGDQ